MDKELYEKLKKFVVKAKLEGYHVDVQYGSIYLSGKINSGYKDRVRLYLHKKTIRDDIVFLCFTADICSMPAGNYYSTIPEARQVAKYWNHLLNVCDYLNNLNIIGDMSEIKDIIELIKQRERK